MLGALFRKQFLELNSFYFLDKKTGKARSRRSTILFLLLYAALFLLLAFAFFGLSTEFASLLNTPNPWLYYSMTGLLSLLLGTFGSVFNTYAGIYHAKDNELLLSLPIPPVKILIARVSGVAVMSLLYECLVLIPAIIARFVSAPISAAGVIFSLLLIPLICLLITFLSCVLGWVVAFLSSKFKNKSFLTVIFSLVVVAVYYYVCSQFSSIITLFVANSDKVGAAIKGWAYPLYLMGSGTEGNILHFLLFTVIVLVLFALACLLLSRTFTSITTKNEVEKKRVYKEAPVKASSVRSALLRRELRHFTSSPTYMLNCGFGIVFMLALTVFAVISHGKMQAAFASVPGLSPYLPILLPCLVCMMLSMIDISAPSVSLEGSRLWIIRSSPVPTREVLLAKQLLHVYIALPPAALMTLVLALIFGMGPETIVFVLILVVVFLRLTALSGLALNLKMPNLTWTNEVIPIKQSISVMLVMFGGWAVSILLGVGGYFAVKIMQPWQYLLVAAAVLLLCTRLLDRWVNTRGVQLFEQL